MAAPDDESPQRALVAALGAMTGVALVVGLAVAGVILTVVNVSGLGGDAGAEEAAPRTMFVPDPTPTPSETAGGGGDGGGGSASPSPSGTPRPRTPITLRVSPEEASAGERLTFTGSYRSGEGSSVRVQRKEGGSWIDFPVEAQVRDARYTTYVITSRSGKNVFRVTDKSAERSSNSVTVTIE